MGIYIHGVSIPKDGKVLLIDPWGNVRLYWSKDGVAVGTGLYVCKASELPPHGRLGDLDEMAVDESEAYMSAQLKLGDDVITKAINEAVHAKIVRLIADTPTIIPAEEGDAE